MVHICDPYWSSTNLDKDWKVIPTMSNRRRLKTITKKVCLFYGAWVAFWLSIALYGKLFTYHGEFGVSSHFWLNFTGMPLSFISWLVPHGSITGVIVSGVAGCIQWCLVIELDERLNNKNNLTRH